MNTDGKIQIEEKDSCYIFHLNGKFVGDSETDLLKNQLEELAKSAKNRVILDFSNVLYFSSLALGILVKEDELFTEKEGKLIITEVPSFLENIFEITKLSNIFNITKKISSAEVDILH